MAHDNQWVWGIVPSPSQETELDQLNTVLLGSLLTKSLLFFAGEESIEDHTSSMVIGFVNGTLDQVRCSRLLGGSDIDIAQVMNALPSDFIFRVRLNQPDQGGIAEANYHTLSDTDAEIIAVEDASATVHEMMAAMGTDPSTITLVKYKMYQEPDDYHSIDNVALYSEPERIFGIDSDPLLLAGEFARDLPKFLHWADCRDDLMYGNCFVGECNAEIHG